MTEEKEEEEEECVCVDMNVNRVELKRGKYSYVRFITAYQMPTDHFLAP